MVPKFDFVAVVVEESKELPKLTLDDLSLTLLVHEVRVNHASAKLGDKALVVKGHSLNTNYSKGVALETPGEKVEAGEGSVLAGEEEDKEVVDATQRTKTTFNAFTITSSTT